MIRRTLHQLFDAMSFANVGSLGEFHRLMEAQPCRAHEANDRATVSRIVAQRPAKGLMPMALRLVPKRSSSR